MGLRGVIKLQKPTMHKYPCRICGKKWLLSDMSKQLMCFTCIGRATIAGGKLGGERHGEARRSARKKE